MEGAMDSKQSLLGIGIYTVSEAAWMTNVSFPRIRRWLRGYKFRLGDKTHTSSAVWKPDLPVVEDTLSLSFRDLIEVRFIDSFLKQGVNWRILKLAATYASEIVNSTHPFSTKFFKTDGKTIFADFERQGDRRIVNVIKHQYAIPSFIAPFLYDGLEFKENQPSRWFPLSNCKRIVIDPAISFGQPVLNPEGVPTRILSRAFEVEKSIDRVAYWYNVPKRSVQDAVGYQQRLAA
jgi:uncharacterized protein (DUF433 family)